MDSLLKFLKDKIVDKMPLEEIVDVFEQMCSIPPVSYTHLDVYKRQGVYSRAVKKGLKRFFIENIAVDALNPLWKLLRIRAVAYTHLPSP